MNTSQLFYQGSITTFDPVLHHQTFECESPQATLHLMQTCTWSNFIWVVNIYTINPNVSQNIFIEELAIWANSQRCVVQRVSSIEEYLKDTSLEGVPAESQTFFDDDGSSFTCPYSRTVSRDQAFAEFERWLNGVEIDEPFSWSVNEPFE